MSTSRKTLMSLIKTTVEELPVDEAFLLDLKATVSMCNPQRPRSRYYKPSALNCTRGMYFDGIQAEQDVQLSDYNGTRICETGSKSHESIQYYVCEMRKSGKDCDYIDVGTYIKENNLNYLEVKHKAGFETKLFDTRYNLSFLCDGIIKYKGKYYILEIKTEIDEKSWNRTGPADDHLNQASCYSLSFGIDDIIWIYEERNFCTPKVFLSKITDDMKQKVVDKINEADQAIKSGIAPPKAEHKKVCTYCCYKKVCKETR